MISESNLTMTTTTHRVILDKLCEDCGHLALGVVDNDGWCPYCLDQKVCSNDDCEFCFEKTLACLRMAKMWHPTKNGTIRPRDVLLNGNDPCKRFWFVCDVCKTDFSTQIGRMRKHCDEKVVD